jgi:hypothetical protein
MRSVPLSRGAPLARSGSSGRTHAVSYGRGCCPLVGLRSRLSLARLSRGPGHYPVQVLGGTASPDQSDLQFGIVAVRVRWQRRSPGTKASPVTSQRRARPRSLLLVVAAGRVQRSGPPTMRLLGGVSEDPPGLRPGLPRIEGCVGTRRSRSVPRRHARGADSLHRRKEHRHQTLTAARRGDRLSAVRLRRRGPSSSADWAGRIQPWTRELLFEGSQARVTSNAEIWDTPRCKAAGLARECDQSRQRRPG